MRIWHERGEKMKKTIRQLERKYGMRWDTMETRFCKKERLEAYFSLLRLATLLPEKVVSRHEQLFDCRSGKADTQTITLS